MTMSTDPDQHVFGGRYRVSRRIAGGGMGEVWRAEDHVLGRWVAIKVLRNQLDDTEAFRDRFRVEARAAAALAHPAIATVYDYGEEIDASGVPRAFIVMEFVDGQSLETRLHQVGRLSPAETASILGQAAEALQAAHDRGIVHRDVKPGNLMLRPDGAVKLTDFGIARIPGGTGLTEVGVMLGTAQYMAPELVSGSAATPASDIYALGVVAYACVTGRPPFAHEDTVAVAVAHLHDDVPPLPHRLPVPMRELIEQMLEKESDRRPASAGEVAARWRALSTRLGRPSDRAAEPSTRPTATTSAPVGLSEREVPTRVSSPRTQQLSGPLSAVRRPPSHRLVKRLSVVALIAILLGGLALVLTSALTPAVVAVPDLKGVSTAAAVARLGHLGLRAQLRTIDGTSPAGRVVSQRPRPGSRIDAGSTVALTGASGFVDLNAAGVAGKPASTVVAAIQRLGLQPQQRTSVSAAPPGTVLAATPSGRLRLGTAVVVAVAVPPPPTVTQPPDASGPAPIAHGKPGKKGEGSHGG